MNEGFCDEFMNSINTFTKLLSSKMGEADTGSSVFIRLFFVFWRFARGEASKRSERLK